MFKNQYYVQEDKILYMFKNLYYVQEDKMYTLVLCYCTSSLNLEKVLGAVWIVTIFAMYCHVILPHLLELLKFLPTLWLALGNLAILFMSMTCGVYCS